MPTTESTSCATGQAKCCTTCKWWDLFHSICRNRDGDYYDDFTLARETCGGWKQL